ncbi:uncharacterized protein LOC130975173 [Arachis stenosperma]|uniref:uncharacterized protein LOC130975173 n=1 Tax=Arachis stenosperma TaxID=217475 RepID=UPI0025AC3B5A|nr:uncharacterized protein LOC130975173 [Arachis stenosperma]
MRLCMNARVPLEDANPTWLYPGMPMTLERMMNVTEAHQSQKPQRRRRRQEPREEEQQQEEPQEKPQEEQEEEQQFQPQNNMDMVRMQEAIERLSEQYMGIQEKQGEFHSQYMSAQQRQEELQLRMMSQQRDYESRSLVMQKEQASQFQESFNQLAQLQVENMRAFKEFTTLQDARYGVQADYNINGQIKLNYIGKHLHSMDPAFPIYDEYFKKRNDREIDKAIRLEKHNKRDNEESWILAKAKGQEQGRN